MKKHLNILCLLTLCLFTFSLTGSVPFVKPTFYKLTAGKGHTCVLVNQQIECWGRISGTPLHFAAPTDLTSGDSFSCMIDLNQIQCWGKNFTGQLKDAEKLVGPVEISAGGAHLCAIDRAEQVHCWGDNSQGQSTVPPGLIHPHHLVTGVFHTCVLTDTGVECWGDPQNGGQRPEDLINPRKLFGGGYNSCALTDPGLRCWGDKTVNSLQNVQAQLKDVFDVGIGEAKACGVTPQGVVCWGAINPPPPLVNPTRVVVGEYHGCALTDKGIKCWDGDSTGTGDVPVWAPHTHLIAAGGVNSCAVSDNGLDCPGNTSFPAPFSTLPPVQITAVDVTSDFGCAIVNGQVRCWVFGGETYVPPGLKNPHNLTVFEFQQGVKTTCVLTDDGLRCWNQFQDDPQFKTQAWFKPQVIGLGKGYICGADKKALFCWGDPNNPGNTEFPMRLKEVTAIAAGARHSCAVQADGNLECWGDNLEGQCDKPADLGKVERVDVGEGNTCAISADRVRCWGDPDTGVNDVPVGLSHPTQIAMGISHACALSDQGAVCWGRTASHFSNLPLSW